MEAIALWKIKTLPSVQASSIEEVAEAETERHLEDVFATSPEILMPGVALVARQLRTSGGPLDLLGIDEEGRLVVFELKRGTLTRDAIAQAIDYASYLQQTDPEAVGRLIEDASGRGGIERIEHFVEWYAESYPHSEGLLEQPPLIVLVGIGADSAARRMVDFLTDGGLDIKLLTFQAFRLDGQLLLARKSEARPARKGRGASGGGSKAANLEEIQGRATELGVWPLFSQVADALADAVPAAYRWPTKTAFTFSFSDTTDEGRPTYRVYFHINLDSRNPGKFYFRVRPLARDVAAERIERFAEQVAGARIIGSKSCYVELPLDEVNWPREREAILGLVRDIFEAWENARRAESSEREDAGL